MIKRFTSPSGFLTKEVAAMALDRENKLVSISVDNEQNSSISVTFANYELVENAIDSINTETLIYEDSTIKILYITGDSKFVNLHEMVVYRKDKIFAHVFLDN